MTSEHNHIFRQMYIENLKLNDNTIYQIVSPEFKGIGTLSVHTKEYTRILPHNDEDIEKDWPGAGVTYPVFIATSDIKLIIVLKEGGTKEGT